jgi:alkylated DNA repair dioxygenase AlkB
LNFTADLFASSTAPEIIRMADADVSFMHGFYLPPVSTGFLDTLLREIPWRQETITVWGKEHLQPRLTSWHGDAGADYAYSGLALRTSPWTPALLRIRADIERRTGHTFNSVLLNLYRDGRDSVGWHSDNEAELGRMPVIASLSLGATRTFRLRHKRNADKPLAIELTDGSLLVMAGATQRFWRHAVDKQRTPCGPRINLTFRNIAVAPRA